MSTINKAHNLENSSGNYKESKKAGCLSTQLKLRGFASYKILLTMPMLTFKDTELEKIEDEQKCDDSRKEPMCDYDYDKTKNEESTSEIAYIRLQWWDNLNDRDKDVIRNIPNFDEDVFLKCICS